MRFLILAHIGDETALRVYAALRARHGAEHVKLVSAEELVLAPYWAHRQKNSQVTTVVRLSDGTLLDSENIGIVFSRLTVLSMPHFESASEADRDYAMQEMNALCLSWLASLPCQVVNAPTPMGLSAPAHSYTEWLLLAGKAGLPVQGYHFTTDPRWCREKTYVPYSARPDNPEYTFERISASPVCRQPMFYLEALSELRQSILVAGNSVIGSLAGRYREQAKHLARIAGCDLLEIMFALLATSETNQTTDRNWKVCGVNPFPHVQTAEAISAIVHLLEDKQVEFQPYAEVRR